MLEFINNIAGPLVKIMKSALERAGWLVITILFNFIVDEFLSDIF